MDSIVVPVANLSGKTQTYRLISTDNHNQTVWEHTGGPDPYNDSAFTSVNELDSDSNGRLFAATESGLYRSTNQGGTWENLSDSYILSDVETVYDVTVDKKDYVYITTSDYELLRSTENGDSWTELLIDYYYQNYHPWQTVVNPTTGDLFVCRQIGTSINQPITGAPGRRFKLFSRMKDYFPPHQAEKFMHQLHPVTLSILPITVLPGTKWKPIHPWEMQ